MYLRTLPPLRGTEHYVSSQIQAFLDELLSLQVDQQNIHRNGNKVGIVGIVTVAVVV